MIPKKIFQTYKVPFDELSDNAKLLIQGWKDNNPDYEYNYYSDQDIDNFIIQNFDNKWHKRYTSLEYPVMKADVFRILAIYTYGGFYADLDLKSTRSINYLNKKNISACIGIHNYALFFHPFFGFSPKHPMMEYLVNSLANSIDQNKLINFNDTNHIVHQKHYISSMHNRDNLAVRYVMDVTGPLWWSGSILKYLGLKEAQNLYDIHIKKIPTATKNIIKQNKIFIYRDRLEKSTNGHSQEVVYFNLLGSSNNFYGDGYESWYGAY
jgi:hypothetical protein